MNEWVRQQISVLRERFYNASHIDQVWIIIGLLYTLSLPFYLFVPTSLMGKISAGIFFGPWIVHYLWRDRYPALKRWIREVEYGQNDGKDPYAGGESTRPYLAYISSTSHRGLTTAGESSRRIRVTVFKSAGLHRFGTVGLNPHRYKQNSDVVGTGRRVFRILWRISSKRIFSQWQSLHFAERLYLVAFAVMFLGVASSRMSGNISYFQSTALLGCIACSLGFGTWILPWLQKIWRSPFGKLAITLLNGSVLVVDVIFARLLVADALGLPPQDFDMTVAVCAWIFYIPVWLLVAALLGAFIAVMFLFYSILLMVIDVLLRLVEVILLYIFTFLLMIMFYFIHLRLFYLLITRFSVKDIVQQFDQSFPVGSNLSRFFEQPRVSLINRSKISKAVFKSFSHVFGIAGIIAVAAYTWQSYPAVTGSLKPAVRALI